MKTELTTPTDQTHACQKPPQQGGLHSGRFKHRSVNSVEGQTALQKQSAKINQSTSLFSRSTRNIFRPLIHLATHGELLSARKQKIEKSKSAPQRRLPFLVKNLMALATKFDGKDKAELYDFSKGCCFALASSYVLYEQMGCPGEYDELLNTVSQDPALGWVFWDKHYDHLADAITDAQKMFKADPSGHDPQMRFLLKLRPFCESLLAFQTPDYTTLKDNVPEQNTEKTAQWIASATDVNSPVLQSTPSYPIGLKESGLCLLLNKIAETILEVQESRIFHIKTGRHIITLKVTPDGFEIRDQNIRNYKRFIEKSLGFVAAKDIADFLNTSQSLLSDLANPDESKDTVFAIKEFTNVSSTKSNSGHTSLETLLAEIPESGQLSINHRNPHNFNQLLLALSCKSSDVAETALAKAIKAEDREEDFFNQQDDFGQTALTLAIARNYANVVDKLLDQPGIRINDPRQDGAIALHTACHYGHAEIVEKLLARKEVLINHKTQDGLTPIQIAIKQGQSDVVKLLINHGADIEPHSLALAREASHDEIIQMIETELKKT
ncbi:MAG: ankyrin repeat domain-containing protein [Endozoicomonas sp.]